MFAINIENLKKKEKILYIKKKKVFLLFTVSMVMNMGIYLNKKNQLKY